MNREIKFRAWDIKRKATFPVATITPYIHEQVDEMVTVANFEKKETYLLKKGEYELMEFTGLLDKNGKEIYEGDIVQVEGAIPAEIYWQYESWQLRNGDKTGGMLGNWESEQIKIIGNIWEDPELLKP